MHMCIGENIKNVFQILVQLVYSVQYALFFLEEKDKGNLSERVRVSGFYSVHYISIFRLLTYILD